MEGIKSLNALGIMSGSSLDGAELALIKTDGIDVFKVYKGQKFLYPEELKSLILKAIKKPDEENFAAADSAFTDFIINAYKEFAADNEAEINIIGFEGHTILFDPDNHCILQIGNAQRLADASGIKTVFHFHNNDIALGGQGAPISAAFYAALSSNLKRPLVFLNIGGTTMLIYAGDLGRIIAFDCGVGNNIINHFMQKHACMDMDYDGKCAICGKIDEKIVKSMLKNKYLHKLPPKASAPQLFLDKIEHMEGLSVADGAATATWFVAEAIAMQIEKFLPDKPEKIIICGGGAHNPTLKRFLRQKIAYCEITTAEEDGFDMSTMEAQSRGFIAVRRLYNMPISFPSSTGVIYPAIGGDIIYPSK